MQVRRHLALLLGTAFALGACTAGAAEPGTEASASSATTAAPTDGSGTQAPVASVGERCIDEAALAAELVADPSDAWRCADAVVIAAGRGNLELAVPLAGALGGPVLLAGDPDLAARLTRLAPTRVVTVGTVPATTPIPTVPGVVVEAIDDPDPLAAGLATAALLGARDAYVVLASDRAARTAAALLAARDGRPLLVIPTPFTAAAAQQLDRFASLLLVRTKADTADFRTRLREVEGRPVLRQLPGADLAGLLLGAAPRQPSRVWLVPAGDDDAVLAVAPLAAAAGHAVLTIADLDAFSSSAAADRLQALTSAAVPVSVTREALASAGAPEADHLAWQLTVLASGRQAPGGGFTLAGKRFVALYGSPGTRSLGVLGEQDLDATVARVREIAATYDDGTLHVVPTFEIIADVASASATEDGDYSYSLGDDVIRTWVDRAALEGIEVILDIQPGRTDFLTHAKALEEFLVQPHVGLGLDPEWRLEPGQVHLRQIGSVDGAEVATVVDYLAGLVREHGLPQKMLVLHQFQLRMIPNRDLVEVPAELLVALHMDGQGSLGAKYGTYAAIFDDQSPQQQGMVAGWKNFYDEDRPMANPGQVLALAPQPVFITFQ